MKNRFNIITLLCLLALFPLHHAKADTCQMYTGTPPTSSNPDGSQGYLTCNKQGQLTISTTPATGSVQQVQPTPAGTPLTCSTSGASTANLVCTLAGTSGKTTYINGLSITCQFEASTAVSTTATLAGIISGTQTYQVSEVTSPGAAAVLGRVFVQPIPASAANTSIVLTLVGITGGTTCSVNAEGYQQ